MLQLRGLRPRFWSVGIVVAIGFLIEARQPVFAGPPTDEWNYELGAALMTDYSITGVRGRMTRLTIKSGETGLIVGGEAQGSYGFYASGNAGFAPDTGGTFEQRFGSRRSILSVFDGSVDGGAFYSGHVEAGVRLPGLLGVTASPFVAYNILSPQISGTYSDGTAVTLVDQKWQALQVGAQIQATFWQNWVFSVGGQYSPVTQVRNDELTGYGTGWGVNGGVGYIPPEHPNWSVSVHFGVTDMCASGNLFATKMEFSEKTYYAVAAYQVQFDATAQTYDAQKVAQDFLVPR